MWTKSWEGHAAVEEFVAINDGDQEENETVEDRAVADTVTPFTATRGQHYCEWKEAAVEQAEECKHWDVKEEQGPADTAQHEQNEDRQIDPKPLDSEKMRQAACPALLQALCQGFRPRV